jgi:hypothetical protein
VFGGADERQRLATAFGDKTPRTELSDRMFELLENYGK